MSSAENSLINLKKVTAEPQFNIIPTIRSPPLITLSFILQKVKFGKILAQK